MTPERWQQLKAIFSRALELEGGARASYVDETCREDPQMRAEVDALLRAERAPGAIIDRPAVEYLDTLGPAAADSYWIGRIVGAHRIISLVATGGMGEVYRAVRADGLYPQEVAVKLIRRELAGALLLDRFRAEREILAALQHPHIARILDAGIAEGGLPYIVMELIDGEPIDRYCERGKLSIRRRIELFIDVCAAVHFAHQHLTVHRDLKPQNILVTADGQVKLLDFGIAKVLDPDHADAITTLQALTPEYSSPEQIRREPITTATDIYSLGVILYRLLTGRSPYRTSGSDPYSIAREVCDTQPVKPSANVIGGVHDGRGRLAADLDSIVLLALRKEPNKRYQSVQAFAVDLQRFLDNRTVTARPRTWSYSASRFMARNRALTLAIVLLVAVLGAGTFAVRRQAQIATQERDRAQRHFNSVRQLANTFMFEIHDEIAKLPGSNKARKLVVDTALNYLDLLARESGDDAALKLELAEAYLRVGEVQGQIGYNNLGDHAAALTSYQRAISLLEPALGDDPASRSESLQLSRAYALAAGNLAALGRLGEQGVMISRNVDLMSRRLARVPNSVEVKSQLGQVLYNRSQFIHGQGNKAAAMADAQRTVELFKDIVARNPDYKYQNKLVYSFSNLGDIQLEAVDPNTRTQGIESLRTALMLMRKIASDRSDDVNARRHLAVTAGQLGGALVDVGKPREALPYMNEAMPIFQALYQADKTNRLARLDVAVNEENLGNLWVALGGADKGIEHCRAAVELLMPLPEPPESDLEISAAWVEAQTDLGEAYAAAAAIDKTPLPRQQELWLAARLSASASLSAAQAVVAKKPAVGATYADFIAKDQALLAHAAQRSTTGAGARRGPSHGGRG